MRHFYTLRCPAPFWLIQCKPYQNRFIIAKVIDKSLGARFFMAHCVHCVRQRHLGFVSKRLNKRVIELFSAPYVMDASF